MNETYLNIQNVHIILFLFHAHDSVTVQLKQFKLFTFILVGFIIIVKLHFYYLCSKVPIGK